MTIRVQLSHSARIIALALGIGGLGLVGCDGDDGGTADEDHVTPVEEAATDVEYEPAYPEDVSAEDLSAEDIRQQEIPHGHDGEAHAHDDEGEGEHDHGDDGHVD